MRPFTFHRADTVQAAIAAAQTRGATDVPPTQASAQFIAGGTNMTDYMALDVARPEVLIDINSLHGSEYRRIEANESGIRFGALVRMSQAEDHPIVARQYPLIRESLRLAASGQIRNMASLGGNVLQRTRCEYFREISWPCNKRHPGSGCSALGGVNRQHAILGASEHCIASYPGDFAQALIALDATVETRCPQGPRTIRFADLHREPRTTPNVETTLRPGELITFITVPAGPWTARSLYVKVRDRVSYEFALAAAAVALDLDGDRVRTARIALGGVATIPWRARQAEAALTDQVLDEQSAARAADLAFAGATPQKYNAFKIPLGKQTVVRALVEAKAMRVT